ncbi:hypothetical protein K402DRAFT_400666 [Aulographum hederae CBS 113979]|uniref:Ca3427-like PBP 2 domain-containing protein n=1 Tax=Aulographum hederae CBS 113979 TaxID=1176131 RepID=A0A6G1HDB1_9PEZI|nr:hypothetical protein K402DRAFT_400666 [Aulographum hederae CBS 113979]
MSQKLRIGFVPEHFSTPLHFASTHYGLSADLIPYPSGTGHMIQSLKADEIDVGIGLTEGWVAGLGKAKEAEEEAPYKIVGTYVETPLCWAISTGSKRDVREVEKGMKLGVSRIGSGSYVMGFVLADQKGWLDPSSSNAPFDIIPLNTFARLREGVNDGTADIFMWEHFTSKRYYDNGEIKRIGEIYTPWSSWKIVAKSELVEDERIGAMLDAINKGVKHFKDNQEEAVKYIYTNLDYSEEDARAWLGTVKFAEDVKGVDRKVVDKTIGILGKAGVLDAKAVKSEEMIGIVR